MHTSIINNVSNSINTITEESTMNKEQILEHNADKLNAKIIITESGIRDITWKDNWMPIGHISYSNHENKHMHKVAKHSSTSHKGTLRAVVAVSTLSYIVMCIVALA